MAQFGMGQPVRRTEDQRLVTGRGRYTDDIVLPDQAYGYVVRSPHAHARILAIDTAAAAAAPGVLAVLTAAELAADGIGAISTAPATNRDGTPAVLPPRPVLAADRVRHVGDQVAFIVAESYAAARDAAELVEVDYEILPSVTETGLAMASGQPLVWDEVPGNLCLDWEAGDAAATAAGFAGASKVVALDLINNRIVVNSIEPRNCLAEYDAASQRYTVYASSQGVHPLRNFLAETLGVPRSQFRVVTGDVGGGFGMKLFCYPEHVLVVWAARRVGRPVRWNAERGESFLSDTQGRDHVCRAEVALDADGRFLAWRFRITANLGAYLSNYALFIPTEGVAAMLAGVYTSPAVHVRVAAVFTNTTPVDAYRGAGRPEAAYAVERLVDHAARSLGLAPEELRRRNFIRAEQMPYKTAFGLTYDSGDFAANMEDALRIIDRPGFERRRAEAAARGRLRGLGIATYIEQSGGGSAERALLRFDRAGMATLLIGTQASGQGHETSYAQVIAGRLGLPLDRIKVVQGDTDLVLTGQGTGGSRSLPIGGAATDLAAEKLIERGRKIAGHLMEAAAADVEFADGIFTIAGTDRRVDLATVIAAAFDGRVPDGVPAGNFEERARWAPEGEVGTFPNGTHAVELEIDPETGAVELLRYVVVDDFGTVVNPLLLEGQVQGGIVQGIGQALWEGVVYDPESGQLLTGSLMDYALPHADQLGPIEFSFHVVPCTTNRLGIKGAGEAGAIGAPPAVINAVVDALAPLGITHVDMPATPRRIWEAIAAAGAHRAAA